MKFPFDIFTNIPPNGHLYFFYGLVFFFLAISTMFTYKRTSEFILANSLWLMAAFGFTHGAYAWVELFLLLQTQDGMEIQIFLLNGIKILLFISSFLFLMHFGLTLISHTITNKRRKMMISAVPVILLFFWVVPLWNQIDNIGTEFLSVAYISAKYTLGLTGALLTAYGVWSFSREAKSLSTAVSKKLLYASIVFVFFGIVLGIVPSQTLLPYIHVPVEVFVSFSVVLITYFLLNAVSIFDTETKRKLKKQIKRVEQSEKLISIGRLAAGIAHEINNPLTNAVLNVEMLKKSIKDMNNPEVLTKLHSLEKNINRAATIAKELLQFSRSAEPDMMLVDINNIVKGSLTLMHHKFNDMNVHTNFSDLPASIADPVKLEQVMMNILDNAQQAMHAGDDIWIESSSHNDSITIIIRDSGKGISRENLSRVFDPFFTTKDVGIGTGLGLSICYGIIEQHNGEIDIESKEGEGTTVAITLPLGNGNMKKNLT
jgi:signal transduction histidine kinase